MPNVRPDSLVFAARRAPYPVTNGSRLRGNRLLAGLSRAFETTLVTFEHHPESPDGLCPRQELELLFPGVEVVTAPGTGHHHHVEQARSLVSRRSWMSARYVTPAFRSALQATVARVRPAIVHLDEQALGGYGPLDGTLTVLATHNVDHEILRGMARAAQGRRRVLSAVEWRKVRREAEWAWRRMPLCLAVSEGNAEVMRAAGARRVEVCPNGTDPVERLAPPRRGAGEPLRILFVGSGSFDPYERGLAWFVHHVIPPLRERVPVEFDVIGERPRRPVRAPGVTYAGPVPSVRPWYQRAHVAVVPVFERSGTRLKIIEAMAQGRPVVSTTPGASGLPLSADVHYRRADDAEAFVVALAGLAEDIEGGSDAVPAMLDRARSAIASLFWPEIVDRLVDLYRGEIEARASRAGGAA
jgi:glycosyltransferase involved in cell wall biosynthesis